MNSSKVVGAGVFVVIGAVLFTAALFLIGERRMLFVERYSLYTEFKSLGQIEVGNAVRVAGADAGEITEIRIPSGPSDKFRVKMEIREDLKPLIRTDSVATTQTEGLVGSLFINIATGTDQGTVLPEDGIVPSKEPFSMADLLQQMSETVTTINTTVESLSGDVQNAVKQVAATAEDAHAMFTDIRPDVTAMVENGKRISGDVQLVVNNMKDGKGTLGKLMNDDQLYNRIRDIATQAQEVVTNVKDVTGEAKLAIADFRSKDGPAQGLVSDMRLTLAQAREATGDLADNMEAMKHNFLLKGFFNKRGYFDLNAISPVEYRSGVLEAGKRKAMRIWLSSAVLFEKNADGVEVLTEAGRARVDSAMSTYLKYLPTNPIVVEGYAGGATVEERFILSKTRASLIRQYVMDRYSLPAQNTGFIALADDAVGSPDNGKWEGVALTLFLDRADLSFATQTATR